MRPLRDKGMLQGLRRRDPLVGIERQAALQQVDEVVEFPCLRIVHAARRGQEAGAQVARRLDHRQGSDGRLYRVLVSKQTNKQSASKTHVLFQTADSQGRGMGGCSVRKAPRARGCDPTTLERN